MRKSVLAIPLLSLWAVVALADPQPAPAAATAQAQPAAAPTEAMTQSLADYLKTLDDGGPAAHSRYIAAFHDLNGDGVPEAIVYMIGRDWCGSGGCTLFVLTQKGGNWARVSQSTITSPPIYVLSSVSNGWHSLGVQVRDMRAMGVYEAQLNFDGKTYPLNPTVPPAQRMEGTPQGEVVIQSAREGTKFIYSPAGFRPQADASPAAPADSLVGFLRKLNDQAIQESGGQHSDRPVFYVSAYADLNGDGTPEAVVYMSGPNWCGSGGCTTLVLTLKDNTWTKVAEIGLASQPIYVLPDVSNGWHGLGVLVRDIRALQYYEVELDFNGKTYPTNPTMPPAHRLNDRSAHQVLIGSKQEGQPLYAAAQ